MTDTAQPLPDEQTEEGALTPEMAQRAAALGIARQILKSSALFGQNGVQGWSVQDLLTVSDYILGVGPFVSLEQIGAAPIDSPDNRAEGTEILEYGTTFRAPSYPYVPQNTEDMGQDDEPTEALPSYPEDALPR